MLQILQPVLQCLTLILFHHYFLEYFIVCSFLGLIPLNNGILAAFVPLLTRYDNSGLFAAIRGMKDHLTDYSIGILGNLVPQILLKLFKFQYLFFVLKFKVFQICSLLLQIIELLLCILLPLLLLSKSFQPLLLLLFQLRQPLNSLLLMLSLFFNILVLFPNCLMHALQLLTHHLLMQRPNLVPEIQKIHEQSQQLSPVLTVSSGAQHPSNVKLGMRVQFQAQS